MAKKTRVAFKMRSSNSTPFKHMGSSPVKGKLDDLIKNFGAELRTNKKSVSDKYAEKKSRKAGESKFQADVRRRRETNKAKRASNKADAEYYRSAEDKAKNSEANRIESEESKHKGDYYTFSGKPGDKFKYRKKPDWDADFSVQERYEFQRPGSDVWETSKTEAGSRAMQDLYIDDYEGKNVEITPIQKKSPYKKGLGKYAKKAKGKRGYKMKRK